MKTGIQEQKKRQVKNPIKAQDRSMIDLLGYRSCQDGLLQDREGQWQAYLKIRTDDLDSLAIAAKIEYMDALTTIARTYTADFKILVATTQVDTSPQQRYYTRLLIEASQHAAQSASPNWHARRELAAEVLRDVTDIGNSRNDLNFYIVLFGETKQMLLKNVAQLQKMGRNTCGLVLLETEDVEGVLYRVNNPNDE